MTSTPGVCRECCDCHGVRVPAHAGPCSDCHDTSCTGNKSFGRFSSYQAQGSGLVTLAHKSSLEFSIFQVCGNVLPSPRLFSGPFLPVICSIYQPMILPSGSLSKSIHVHVGN